MAKKISYKKIYFRVTGTPEQFRNGAGDNRPVHLGYTDDPRKNCEYYTGMGWKPWELSYQAMEKQAEGNKIIKPESK